MLARTAPRSARGRAWISRLRPGGLFLRRSTGDGRQEDRRALHGAAAAIGGVLAGANPIQADALYQFGVNSGVAFQIDTGRPDRSLCKQREEREGPRVGYQGRKQTLIAITAREKGLDLARTGELTGAEIDDLIARLECRRHRRGQGHGNRAGNRAKEALSILPIPRRSACLAEIADFFINRGNLISWTLIRAPALHLRPAERSENKQCPKERRSSHGVGKHPEFGAGSRRLALCRKVVAKVAAMDGPETEEPSCREIAPELLDELTETREHSGLPAPGAENGCDAVCAEPEGRCTWHARASILNDYYVRRYGAVRPLRIEDTDPRRVDPEAYEMVLEDIEWLGLITDIVYQSDRLEVYYDWCRKLIELGGAYVCLCDAERFRELKLKKKACPCRDRPVEENLELWQRMLDGEFYEGDATVRVKTDLTHPDPAMGLLGDADREYTHPPEGGRNGLSADELLGRG